MLDLPPSRHARILTDFLNSHPVTSKIRNLVHTALIVLGGFKPVRSVRPLLRNAYSA